MTDEQIIKTLECCLCSDELGRHDCCECDLFEEDCIVYLRNATIDLINRQKAEIERLTSLCTAKDVIIEDQEAKIERISENSEAWVAGTVHLEGELWLLSKKLKTARAEAIEEFAERLKEKAYSHKSRYLGNTYDIKAVDIRDIDNLVQEMTEENFGK